MSTTVNNQKLDRLEKDSNQLKTARFAIESKDVQITETENELIIENIPVQALGQDRDGDKITSTGQDAVVQQLQSGNVPAFPNHGIGDHDAVYDFRDIMGQWIDGEHRDGTTYGDLRLRKGNDAAEHLKDLLEQDMPVGFSVGFIPEEFDENKETGGMEIDDLDLMEISPVGIPSKPEAVNELESSPVAMAKSIMEENKEKNAETVSKKYVERLKHAMKDKDETKDKVKNKNGKSEEKEVKTVEELVKSTREQKQLTADEVDTVMEIINLHNEAVKEDIRTFMEEEELIEEESEQDSEEEDDYYDDDKDDDKEVETNGSDQNEDKSGEDESAESENKENKETEQEESEETEKGLSDEEKTLSKKENESGKSENKINTLDKDSDSSESKSEKDFEDPFKITPNSKA